MKGLALVALGFVAMLGTACSSEQEKSSEISSIREGITGIGTLAFELPLGTEVADVAVSATNLVYVGDRAKVQPATSTSGAATLTSTGSGETTIGVKAQTRSIVSEGAIALRNEATVTGNVVTHQKVTKQTGVTVTGTTTEDAVLTPKRRVTRDYSFPGGTSYTRGPDAATLPLSPGGFGDLTINARSTVVLNASAGAPFYFESITVEPQATLEVRTSGGFTPILVRGALNFKGTFKLVGNPADVFIGVFGTGTTSLESVVSGTIMAPTERCGSPLPSKSSVARFSPRTSRSSPT